jgi:hypothetical protein
MAHALFMVRAVVPEADRAAFDAWYAREHLPDAMRAFGARMAWRAWSRLDLAVHMAFYRFDSVAAAEAATAPATLQPLIAEFDRRWSTRVTRSRDILDVVDEQATAG